LFSPFFLSITWVRVIMKYFIVLILSIFLLQSCSSSIFITSQSRKLGQLHKDIAYLLDDPNLGNAYLGIYIESLGDDRIIFHQNEHKLFIPASNMKLYTSATGLVKLGENFRYQTIIGTDSTLSDSVLMGNLIIRGMGDPSISGKFNGGDILAYFYNWADSLKNRGIKKIEGKLIGDNSYFESDILADGWNWDDEPFWYSVQPSALSFNDNCVDFMVNPANKVGVPVRIEQNPGISYLDIENKAMTSPADSLKQLDISRTRAQNIAQFSGTLPLGYKTVKESISVERPAEFFLQVFQNVLKDKGITITGGIEVHDAYVAVQDTLFIHRSPELSALLKVLNKKSHNFYADQILKTLGARFGEEGSFKKGTEIVAEWLHSIGVPPSEFIMVDGSGLSRKNLISPFATATLLRWMFNYKDFSTFYNSLPIAGVDGTLKNLMRNSAAQGNVYAKTGTMRHVRSLSGYVKDKNNNPYIFVIMVNNHSVPVAYIKELQGKICILLSNYN